MTISENSTSEAELGALIDSLRHSPDGPDELAALLPENLPIYAGRSAAEVDRLRGYLLAAFADAGLPDAALPYVIESLETGHLGYEVAGAAIGLRGVQTPPAGALAALLRAIDNLSGADATVSFESYPPAWPCAQPTSALTEVVRTIGHFGGHGRAAMRELERLARQRERFSSSVIAEMRSVLEKSGSWQDADTDDAVRASGYGGGEPSGASGSDSSCCSSRSLVASAPDHDTSRAVLEDQDGRTEHFDQFFRGKPSIVTFFYTRCDNPYKCSLTITKLAALQRCLDARGLTGAVKVTAISYDPQFDLPERLRWYGSNRGVQFHHDARFFRVTSGFQEIRQRFDLGVNYGAATVNRHQTEVYLLNEQGDICADFRRVRWEVEAVLAAVEMLLKPAQA